MTRCGNGVYPVCRSEIWQTAKHEKQPLYVCTMYGLYRETVQYVQIRTLYADVRFVQLRTDLSSTTTCAKPPVPSSPLVALVDLFMHKLNEAGSMSREELVELAVKQGFSPTPNKRCRVCTLCL